MLTTQSQPDVRDDCAQALQCMEIWGGNTAEDAAISVPGIDVWVHARPALGSDAGGDIHYVSTCGAGKLTRFVVVDVAGHGPAVSEISTALRKQMRKLINTPLQTKLVRALSDEFGAVSDAGQFATGVFASYHAPTSELILVNAGHPRPMLRTATTGKWSIVHHTAPDSRSNFNDLPLGIIEGADYTQFVLSIEPGDVVLFFTDALPETTDSITGNMLGEQGLLDLMQSLEAEVKHDPSTLAQRLSERLDIMRGQSSDDDVTIMTLHHNGSGPNKISLSEKARVMAKMLGLIRV